MKRKNKKKVSELEKNLAEFMKGVEESRKRSEKSIAEMKKGLKESRKQFGEFTNRFGYFVEGLTVESFEYEFNNLGVKTTKLYRRPKAILDGKSIEFDIFLIGRTIKNINSYLPEGVDVLIVLEAKAELTSEKIKEKQKRQYLQYYDKQGKSPAVY